MKNTSFVVRDKSGEYVTGYNIAIGERVALASARQCACSVKGDIFKKQETVEEKIYEWEDGELKKIE